jgi:tetratricopeptide (TPR) repeat protein
VAAPTAAPALATAAPPVASAAAHHPTVFNAARQLILEGKYEVGLAAMRTAGPETHPDVAAYVGLAHRKLGRIDEAKSWYDRALAADAKHKLTLSFYGMLRADQGDLAGARLNLQKIRLVCGNTSCNEYQALYSVIASKIR